MMNNLRFSHLIVVDEYSRRLNIYRIFENGEKQLYTWVELPAREGDDNKFSFEEFARNLGENILLDSPLTRSLLGL